MSVFDEVKQALNIRQVVEFYGYKVNRAGQFVCPFHNDSHPSASIKNDYFNCFVCGTGGDLIKFTALLFGLNNYEACKKLIADFNLNISINKPMSKLQAYKERMQREAAMRERKNKEELIKHTGIVLASYHSYLWNCKQVYGIDDKRHIRALYKLTEAEYYLECYDADPEGYSVENRKQVENIENELRQWNNEGK